MLAANPDNLTCSIAICAHSKPSNYPRVARTFHMRCDFMAWENARRSQNPDDLTSFSPHKSYDNDHDKASSWRIKSRSRRRPFNHSNGQAAAAPKAPKHLLFNRSSGIRARHGALNKHCKWTISQSIKIFSRLVFARRSTNYWQRRSLRCFGSSKHVIMSVHQHQCERKIRENWENRLWKFSLEYVVDLWLTSWWKSACVSLQKSFLRCWEKM